MWSGGWFGGWLGGWSGASAAYDEIRVHWLEVEPAGNEIRIHWLEVEPAGDEIRVHWLEVQPGQSIEVPVPHGAGGGRRRIPRRVARTDVHAMNAQIVRATMAMVLCGAMDD